MKHEQPYWKCRTVSEINNLVVDFYNPLDFLNFGESMLSASIDQDLYKLMFTGSNNLFGSFIDRDLDFAVLYMVDPKQSRVTGGWTIDGHIDMELKIYRIKVMHALEWVKVPYSDVPKNIAKGTLIPWKSDNTSGGWGRRSNCSAEFINVSIPNAPEELIYGCRVTNDIEQNQMGMGALDTAHGGNVSVKSGQKYCLSSWVKNTSDHVLNIRLQLGTNSVNNQGGEGVKYIHVDVPVPNDGKWHHIQGVLTIPNGKIVAWQYIYTSNAKKGDTFEFAGYKWEAGEIATPWAPHITEILPTSWEVQDNGWVYNGNTSKNTTLQCVYWALNYKFNPNNEASGYTRYADQYTQELSGNGCVITGYMIRGLKGY